MGLSSDAQVIHRLAGDAAAMTSSLRSRVIAVIAALAVGTVATAGLDHRAAAATSTAAQATSSLSSGPAIAAVSAAPATATS
jgi:hypothetical protein